MASSSFVHAVIAYDLGFIFMGSKVICMHEGGEPRLSGCSCIVIFEFKFVYYTVLLVVLYNLNCNMYVHSL